MTDFVASYFMLCLAVAMLIVGLLSKQNWVLMISGGFWVITGVYYLANAGSTTNFTYALGWICVAVSLPLFLSYLWHHEKKEPDEIGKDDTHREYLMKSTDKLYKSRNPNRRNIDL